MTGIGSPSSSTSHAEYSTGTASFVNCSLLIVALTTYLCSGATSWLLLCVTTDWNWLLIIAVPGLHASLLLMLSLPLAWERQTGRPGSNISTEKYQALFSGPQRSSRRLHFLQARVSGGNVIHFRGRTYCLDPSVVWLPALLVSAFCATAYVCQYMGSEVARLTSERVLQGASEVSRFFHERSSHSQKALAWRLN